MSARDLAAALGLDAEFASLQRLRRGTGDPQPEDIVSLPRVVRAGVLGIKAQSDADGDRGLRRLIDMVDNAPSRDRDLLRMAFNFDKEYGSDTWVRRVGRYVADHGGDERTVREKVDVAILQLLQRTQEAAEKAPEPGPQRGAASDAQADKHVLASEFFNQNYVRNSEEFVSAWASSKTVEMCGFGHNRMLVAYSSEIVHLLKSGGSLKVLLQNPEGRAVIDANFRSSTPKASDESVRHQHRAGIATLTSLQRLSHHRGSITVRVYDIVPPFTAYFFDAESDGIAFIWFWSWRQASAWRPGFAIRGSTDPLWFERFYNQFTAMWTDEEMSTELEIGV